MAQTLSRRSFVATSAAAAATAVAALSVTGCSSNEANQSSNTSTTTEVKVREDFNVALNAQPPSMDPLMTVGNVTAEVANCIFEPLYVMDANYEPQPLLATDYEVSDDGLTYTFTLKQDVKFHDGSAMTAEDVVASMQRWVSLNSRAQALFADGVWAKVSDDKVSFTISQAASDVLIVMSNYQQFAAIMPKAVVDAATDTGVTDFIGTGPYAYNEWVQDQYVHLTKFADYHGGGQGKASGYAGQRQAQAEDLYFQIATDASTRVNALTKGQYDVIDSIPTSSYETLKSNSDVTLYTNTGGYLCVYMNTTANGQLNQTLRQAVEYAINCDDMLKSVYGSADLYTKDYGYMNPNMSQWKVDGGADYYDKYDIEKAKQLLVEGGYNGETIQLLTTGDYEQMSKGTEFVAEALRQIGVECNINSYEFAKYMEEKATFAGWDITVCTQSYQTTPSQLNVVSPSFNGLDDEEILSGVAAIRTAATSEAAAQEWSKVQERLYEYGAGYVVGHSLSLSATGASVEGFENFVLPVVYNAYVPE